jgi:RNA polymerase sigma-B factor
MAEHTDATAATQRQDQGERTRELFERIASDPAAREELVREHMGLAEYLARRFAGRGEPVEDLVQVASIGLIKAVDRFDVTREVQFSTYATATIVGELKRHFRDKGWALRVPRRLQEAALVVNRETSEMYKELGRSPTVAELSHRTGLTQEEILEAMEALQAYTASSLDAPSDDELGPSDTIGVDDAALQVMDQWANVAPHLRKLAPRERHILYMRFFEGRTQSEIADEIGISQMHVSRLLAQTVAGLRRKMLSDE